MNGTAHLRDTLIILLAAVAVVPLLRRLHAARLERAQAVVITVDEPESASRTVHAVRRIAPEVPVLTRARDLARCEAPARAGASAAVPEVVEGSLQLVAALLRQLGDSGGETEQTLGEFRRETYARLADLSDPPGRASGEAGPA